MATSRMHGERVLLLLILLAGFALRVFQLDTNSLWLDEMGQASVAAGGLRSAIAGARLHHGAAPLDYLLTWLALQVAHSDFAVRWPAALLGTLTLALLYRLGAALFSRRAGLLAALLLAFAPLHIAFSREARFYALFTALAVASTLALAIALRRHTGRSWLAYAALLAAGLYSHYYTALLALSHGLTAGLAALGVAGSGRGRDLRLLAAFGLAALAAAGAFLPWLLWAVLRETRVGANPPAFNYEFLVQIAAGLVFGSQATEPPTWLLWAYMLLAGLGAGLGLRRQDTRLGALLALLPLLLGPPLLALGLRLIGYFFALRQVLFLLPFLLLLVSYGATALVEGLASGRPVRPGPMARMPSWHVLARTTLLMPRRQENWLLAGLALLLILPLQPLIANAREGNEQPWRQALAFVTANAGPRDAVLTPRTPAHYFDYYASALKPQMANPGSQDELAGLAAASPALWALVASESGEPGRQAARWLEERQALRLDFGPRMTVYYWRPGESAADVLPETLHWELPAHGQALEQLVHLYDQAGMPEATVRAALQGAMLARDREEASFFYMLLGSVWRARGENERAVSAYRQALALWPENAEALVRLGDRLLSMGRHDEAVEALAKAVKLAPEHYWARWFLASAIWREQPEAAIEQLQAAIALDEAEPAGHYRLGQVLDATGDSAGAATAYRRFLELSPADPQAEAIRRRLSELQAGPF